MLLEKLLTTYKCSGLFMTQKTIILIFHYDGNPKTHEKPLLYT